MDCFKPTEVRTPPPPLCFECFLSYRVWLKCVVCDVGFHLRAPGQDPRDAEAFHTSEKMMASLPFPSSFVHQPPLVFLAPTPSHPFCHSSHQVLEFKGRLVIFYSAGQGFCQKVHRLLCFGGSFFDGSPCRV